MVGNFWFLRTVKFWNAFTKKHNEMQIEQLIVFFYRNVHKNKRIPNRYRFNGML